MDTKFSSNPRSIRVRKALQQGLLDLLKVKPYEKITITNIVNQAGLARHTFYNHYETKDELLYHLIDTPLNKMVSFSAEVDYYYLPVEEFSSRIKAIARKSFEIWQEHPELAAIIDLIDMDSLLINRLRKNYENHMASNSEQDRELIQSTVGQYIMSYKAYAMVGVLRQWFKNGMRHTPEEMAEFLDFYGNARNDVAAIEKFKDVIT